MEREIIFRGKRIDNGEWIHGYYGISGEGTDLERHIIMVSTLTSENFYFNGIEVDPETVSQYTGLKDSIGKQIFDGDVCLHKEYECFGKIKWSLDEACYYFCVCNGYQLFEEEQLYEYVDGLNIIGNIHDNPELLDVQ